MNVVVASPKGGIGRTPVTLALAGTLGHVRGGYVAALEATAERGDLADLAEGSPPRGISELLEVAETLDSAGAVGGYASPQSSNIDVFASTGPRGPLTEQDVHELRGVLDRHYRITVTDTGADQHAAAFVAAVSTADAVVIPVTATRSALAAASRTLMHLADHGRADLLGRVSAIVTHDGGWQDKDFAASLPDRLTALGVRHVVHVPYDLELRRGDEIALERLSKESQRAWVSVAAHVVDCLRDAPDLPPTRP